MMGGKIYDIDQADLDKLRENSNEMLVQLKQAIVHPASISSIDPYLVSYVQRYTLPDGKSTSGVAIPEGEPRPPDAIKDLFQKTVLELTTKSHG